MDNAQTQSGASNAQFPSITDIILLLVGELLLYFLISEYVMFLVRFLAKEPLSPFLAGGISILILLYGCVVLAMNKRKLIGVLSWVFLILFVSLPYILLVDFANPTQAQLVGPSNFINIFIIIWTIYYAAAHLAVHGIVGSKTK